MRFLCNSFTNEVSGLQSIDKFTKIKVFDKDIFQRAFVGFQDVFNVAISRFPRHFEDILENEKLLWLRKTFFKLE